jgi:hypothetical protein
VTGIRTKLERVLWPAAMACAFLIVVPWHPRKLNGLIDLSWVIVLHDAFATGVHFGDQLVFTFGPLGFAYAGYDPRTFGWGLLVWSLVAVSLVFALDALARPVMPSPLLRAAFIVSVSCLAAIEIGPSADVIAVLLAVLFVRLRFAARPHPLLLHAVAVALALLALMKFSFFVCGAAVVAFCAAADLIARRIPWTALTFGTAVAAIWMAARQPLSLLPRYLGLSMEMASGYGEGLSFIMPYYDDRIILAVFLLLSAALTVLAVRRRPLEGLAIAAVLFVAFKAGFMRQDGHDVLAVLMLVLVVVICLPDALSRASPRARIAWITLALTAIPLLSYELTSRNGPDIDTQMIHLPIARVKEALDLARNGTASLDRSYRGQMTMLRTALPLRPEGRSFDVYPSSSGLLTACGLPAARRPVFDACCAYTPRLLQVNADQLRGSSAPDALLFQVAPLDKRFPSLEGSLSWIEILARYAPRADDGSFVLLRRRQTPAATEVVWHAAQDIRSEASVAVPDPAGDLLFASIDMPYTPAGKLMRFLYVTPPLFIRVTDSMGAMQRYRLLPGNARAGFLFSPLVRSTSDFVGLYDASIRRSLLHLTSLTIERPLLPWMFAPRMSITFERVRITPRLLNAAARRQQPPVSARAARARPR